MGLPLTACMHTSRKHMWTCMHVQTRGGCTSMSVASRENERKEERMREGQRGERVSPHPPPRVLNLWICTNAGVCGSVSETHWRLPGPFRVQERSVARHVRGDGWLHGLDRVLGNPGDRHELPGSQHGAPRLLTVLLLTTWCTVLAHNPVAHTMVHRSLLPSCCSHRCTS